jgi:DNA-binding transcriptional ArsR family regulator
MNSGSIIDMDVVVVPSGTDVRLVDPERVDAVRAALPDQDTIESMASVIGLLSDPSRLRLLVALREGGEMCVNDIAAACNSSESSISHALRLLRANRVVRVRRSGRRAFYRLADSHVQLLLDVTLAHASHGDDGTQARP